MDAPAVIIRKVEWTHETEQALTHHASRGCLAILKREVAAGVADLWECRHGPDVLYAVTRVDTADAPAPPEWVICLAVGRGVRHFLPHALAFVRRKGWRLRVHTSSEAMARMMRAGGMTLEEFVLRAN